MCFIEVAILRGNHPRKGESAQFYRVAHYLLCFATHFMAYLDSVHDFQLFDVISTEETFVMDQSADLFTKKIISQSDASILT